MNKVAYSRYLEDESGIQISAERVIVNLGE